MSARRDGQGWKSITARFAAHDDLRELGHAELVGVPAGRERDARRLDPLGPLLGHALLVDLLALDPVGEAAQLRRPLAQRTHDPLADGEVVVDEVALRVPRLGEQHLVGVRDLDEPLPDLDLDERRGHGVTLLGGPVRPCRAVPTPLPSGGRRRERTEIPAPIAPPDIGRNGIRRGACRQTPGERSSRTHHFRK